MAEYYNIVPWSNSNEWFDMCEKLCPNNGLENKKEALKQLIVWKARCPFLPSGIESTFTLLEVIIQDAATTANCDTAADKILRLAYSTAIMRFVNHMFDGETAKGISLYQAAINLNVPSWIVDLRHDTAHSNELPKLQLLRDASELCYDWLYENYWLKHKPFIKDYITGDNIVFDENEYKIGALMNFCVSLSVCANAKTKIKNLADIPDTYMRESILNDLHELFGSDIDVTQMKTTSLVSLINLITAHSKKLLQIKDAVSHLNEALLGEDSMILSLELLKHLDNNVMQNKRSLSKQYVKCFEVLLMFLHTSDILQDFVLELIKLTQKDSIDPNKRLLAALWIAEIYKGIKKYQDFGKKMENITPDGCLRKRKDYKSLYHHWFPSHNNSILFFDFEKPLPHDLTNINFVQPIISCYNPYLTYFIRNMLHTIQPHLPKTIINNICKLADLIAFPDKFPVKSSKIYTANDLKKHNDSEMEEEENDIALSIDEHYNDNETYQHSFEICQTSGNWKVSATDNPWSSCPIAILPWQVLAKVDGSKENDMDINH